MSSPDLRNTHHRPFPMPPGPWVMKQTWLDLLFAHWRVPIDSIGPRIPAGLELDLFEGEAWYGLVPFHMRGIRVRGLPPIPGLSRFPEINFRTYVVHQGIPGVLFLSLDATNPVAVMTARRWFHLPYNRADISLRKEKEIHYRSQRRHRELGANFGARYAPTGPSRRATPGTLEHWLIERYRLYTTDLLGRVMYCDIHHDPWSIQSATAEILENGMSQAHGLLAPREPPLLHYCERMDALFWAPRYCQVSRRD